MPVMSTRGSISVRFCNHLVSRLPATVNYQVPTQSSFYDIPGRYTWIVPEGVTSISVMAVGGGGGGVSWDGSNAGVTGGAGAGYAYMYNYPVTPGTGYTIQVGAGGNTPERYSGQYWDSEDDGTLYDKAGSGASGGIASWFNDRTTCRGGGGSDGRRGSWNGSYYIADLSWGGYWTLGAGLSGGGKAGGLSGDVVTGPSGPPEFGGGGAAGTSATNGGFDTTGIGYYANQSTSGGSTGGGGGGGGGFGRNLAPSQKRSAGGGGGIGIYGITATAPGSGAVGSDASSGVNSGGGSGGSGGTSGSGGEDITSQSGTATPSNGGKYGGGGGAGKQYGGRGSYGGHGAVRIIWGESRAYPSTGTADIFTSVTVPIAPPRTYQVSQQAIFETPGRYTWIVPAGVTSISVMAVGGGGAGGPGGVGATGSANGGGGAGYAYIYNYPVTPGTGYTIQVGAGGGTTERLGTIYWDVEDNGTGTDKGALGGGGGIASWFNDRSTCRGGGGTDGNSGTWTGSGYLTNYAFGGYYAVGAGLSGDGKAGGNGDQVYSPPSGPAVFGGGGGAGTQAPKGGYDLTGASGYSGGTSGGGGGGGYGYSLNSPAKALSAGGGGGIGIYGITATAPGSGAAGTAATSSVNSGGGGGGSGGQPGYPGQDFTGGTYGTTPFSSDGGKYGGGGGGGEGYDVYGRGCGGHGVVRIIWGAGRAYPNTGTADSYSTVTF